MNYTNSWTSRPAPEEKIIELSPEENDRLKELNATPEQVTAFQKVKQRWHWVGRPQPLLGGGDCIMVEVKGEGVNGAGMWLGIEKDGYTHS